MGIIIRRRNWPWINRQLFNQARHRAKVRTIVSERLEQLLIEERLFIDSIKGNRVMRLEGVREYGFSYDEAKLYQLGQGTGYSKPGQQLAGKDLLKVVRGKGAGKQSGQKYDEVEVTLEDLEEALLADLMLTPSPSVTDSFQKSRELEGRNVNLRPYGISSRLDRRATFLAERQRVILAGENDQVSFTEADLRYRMWNSKETKDAIVLLALMDSSGSMGLGQQHIARLFFFWLLGILRRQYPQMEAVFIVHQLEAEEIPEEHFFARGGSGGTKCSSAYRLAWESLMERYSSNDRVLLVHLTDGDNLPSDKAECFYWISQLLTRCCFLVYGEILSLRQQAHTMMQDLQGLSHPAFMGITVTRKEDLYPALKTILKRITL